MSTSYLKTSIDGLNGSGKTWTSGLLASGLAKEYGNGRPVVVFDSEDRWRFLKALVFDPEQIPLIVIRGRSMVGLRDALAVAKAEKASVFVGDQLSTPWMELVSSFSYDDGRLPIERFQQVRRTWNEAVFDFQDGPFHAIGCGRLGYNWERVENEDGKMELLQGDSKFNAGGGNNFGYECDLELEMRRKKRSLVKFLQRKASVEHVCDVIKDATSILNGQQFTFPDFVGGYKLGGYRAVLGAIRPHVEFLQKVEASPVNRTSSKEMLIAGKSEWQQDQTQRAIVIQEFDQNLEMAFGGMTAQAKMFRNLTTEQLTGSMSHTRMEEELPTRALAEARDIVKALRSRIETGDVPVDQRSLRIMVQAATDDVLHPGKGETLLTILGRKSVEAVKAKQPTEAAGD